MSSRLLGMSGVITKCGLYVVCSAASYLYDNTNSVELKLWYASLNLSRMSCVVSSIEHAYVKQ